jgi:hypothetical protein
MFLVSKAGGCLCQAWRSTVWFTENQPTLRLLSDWEGEGKGTRRGGGGARRENIGDLGG